MGGGRGGGMPPQFPPGMMPGGYGGHGGYGGVPGRHEGHQGHGGYGGQPHPGHQGQGAHGRHAGGHNMAGAGRNRAAARGKNNLQLSEHLGEGGGQQQPRFQREKGNKGGGKEQAQHQPVEAVCTVAPDELSTVMLRNLPNGYARDMLLDLLNTSGFDGRYDFVYLPMDFRNGVNLGYAFVNLLTHNDALRAMNIFQHFSTWFYESNKVCEVSWAHPHQGLEEHVERYRNSPVMHQSMPDEYKPMLFHSGVRIPFLPPTKAIRAPKLRPVRDELKFSRQG